jgi:hypothetical protein
MAISNKILIMREMRAILVDPKSTPDQKFKAAQILQSVRTVHKKPNSGEGPDLEAAEAEAIPVQKPKNKEIDDFLSKL